MFKKLVGSIPLALLLVVASAAPGHAALFTGSCALKVVVNFDEPLMWTSTGNPDYTLSISGAADLDPTTFGTQSCVTTLDTLDPFRRTSGSGSGDSTIWSCSSAFSSGGWSQSWFEADGGHSPPPVFGGHTIVGSWNDWTIEVTNPSLSFVGVAQMSLSPQTQATAADGCVWGLTNRLEMIGTMVFQDP